MSFVQLHYLRISNRKQQYLLKLYTVPCSAEDPKISSKRAIWLLFWLKFLFTSQVKTLSRHIYGSKSKFNCKKNHIIPLYFKRQAPKMIGFQYVCCIRLEPTRHLDLIKANKPWQSQVQNDFQ
ncbi:hypothetical protein XELAEV_18016877mg [Xenopus laevis]|uniref:Uncharacterized protein n=1 Tax=Xenopus laevis TaxID=8355 RepID=A0A974HRW1_XENLA|nr:hypothetical protein XELAEV_18016877mg [Xenopus laevis]